MNNIYASAFRSEFGWFNQIVQAVASSYRRLCTGRAWCPGALRGAHAILAPAWSHAHTPHRRTSFHRRARACDAEGWPSGWMRGRTAGMHMDAGRCAWTDALSDGAPKETQLNEWVNFISVTDSMCAHSKTNFGDTNRLILPNSAWNSWNLSLIETSISG